MEKRRVRAVWTENLAQLNSREVLEQDPGGRKRHLSDILLLLPVQNVLDILLLHVKAVTFTDGSLQ